MIRRRGALLAIAACAAVIHAGPTAAAPSDDAIAAIAAAVEDFATTSGYPGIAVVVTDEDGIRNRTGCGVDSRGEAITASTRMPIASVSKTMKAAAVMQLVAARRAGRGPEMGATDVPAAPEPLGAAPAS